MNNKKIRFLIERLWSHLDKRRRRQFVLLSFLILVSAFAEVVSLGAVLPFLGVFTAPEKVFNYPFFAELTDFWGIKTPDQLALPITIIFIGTAMFAGAIRILLLWVSNKLAFSTGTDLSVEVYRRTLYQPYHVHIARNSSDVVSGITNKVNSSIYGVLFPILMLISSIVLFISISTALVVINPMIAFIAALGFGFSYLAITWMVRKRLDKNSQQIAHEQSQVVRFLQEGLGGIRDVLLDGTQRTYCDIYRGSDRSLRQAQGENNFITYGPRFAMEALGMVLIAGLAYGLSRHVENVATVLPVLGALALGAQRLLPAVQQIYSSWASITGNRASLGDLIELLDQPLSESDFNLSNSPLHFQHSVYFDNVRFRYSSEAAWVLDGVSFEIKKGARIAFVGGTGSGKSTLLDLVMGLLMPTEGEVKVDGQAIFDDRLRLWRRNIAHVPQNIFLADTSIAENIAFGIPAAQVDFERVRHAAQQAQIAQVIESRPEGYNAFVGERGIRLSGGQRQRIGIARALYKQASVLVLDEATSALDNATEESVINAINGLDRNLTVIIVAHRLSTVRHCDVIFELDHGKIVAQGTYNDLIIKSDSFRRLAYTSA